jgi:hypothetical protein
MTTPASLQANLLSKLQIFSGEFETNKNYMIGLSKKLMNLTRENYVLAFGLRANIQHEQHIRAEHAAALTQSPPDVNLMYRLDNEIASTIAWVYTAKELKEVEAENKFLEEHSKILMDVYALVQQWKMEKEKTVDEGGIWLSDDIWLRKIEDRSGKLKMPWEWRQQRGKKGKNTMV